MIDLELLAADARHVLHEECDGKHSSWIDWCQLSPKRRKGWVAVVRHIGRVLGNSDPEQVAAVLQLRVILNAPPGSDLVACARQLRAERDDAAALLGAAEHRLELAQQKWREEKDRAASAVFGGQCAKALLDRLREIFGVQHYEQLCGAAESAMADAGLTRNRRLGEFIHKRLDRYYRWPTLPDARTRP